MCCNKGMDDKYDEDGRLNKPLEEYTKDEILYEGKRLAKSYLSKRNFDIIEADLDYDFYPIDFVCESPSENLTVLVSLQTSLCLGDDEYSMPSLDIDSKKQRRFRTQTLLYLADHPKCHSVRYDVIAINIVGERVAKLRHLIGAFSWEDSDYKTRD